MSLLSRWFGGDKPKEKRSVSYDGIYACFLAFIQALPQQVCPVVSSYENAGITFV
jgi:hypothetical protein